MLPYIAYMDPMGSGVDISMEVLPTHMLHVWYGAGILAPT